MNEPSNHLQHPLLIHHLHLVVAQPYPHNSQRLTPDRVIQELTRAPQIVRNRPVQWQYLHTPPNGTCMLAWQPVRQLDTAYASDGYVWYGQEKESTIQHGQNFAIQMFIAESGFVPGAEQVCMHRRERYRLLSSPTNSHDPQLEFVHYTTAYSEHQVPSRAVSLTPEIQKTIQERKFLEGQGNFPERPFMLHDKMNYPTITVPGNPMPSNPYQQAAQMYGRGAMGRPQQQAPPMRGPMGPSPHKRAQPSMGRMPGGAMQNPFAAAQPPPDFLKDEDNHVYGDALDFLTPREISSARYKQHHEWMEEILSSSYHINQILPVNLGLKLDGKLGRLTDGLYFDTTEGDEKDARRDGLNVEQIPDFEKRVDDFIKDSENEIAEMKRAHQQKMEEMAQQKQWALLERKLTGQPTNATLDAVQREAETAAGMKLVSRSALTQVSKGGILEQIEEVQLPMPQDTQDTQDNQEFNDFTDMDTAGEALDFFDQAMDYPTA